jgi:hypothetical protein
MTKLLIALDYDNTYTADSVLFDIFVQLARSKGYKVHVVTMRHESEPINLNCAVDKVHYTDRKAKKPYMDAKGLSVDIWIDDRPDFILNNAIPRNKEG